MLDVQGQQKHVIGYMKDFLFEAEQADTAVSALSGGERGRLMLALALAKPSNLLVLDEPTNDLDLETLDLLEELLADYKGTLLLVSHDRDFLDRVVTSVIYSDGDGDWTEYAGGYSDMRAQQKAANKARNSSHRPEGPGNGRSGSRRSEKKQSSGNTPTARAKLSYKQKYALETLPLEIESLENEIEQLNALLADADLFSRDPQKFKTLTEQLAQKSARLATAEEEYLELEILREELEQS